MTRQEFSKKTKDQAFKRSQGHCEVCTVNLSTGNIEYDHRIACAIGGDNSLSNCVTTCKSCHSIKTRTKDVPMIAKGRRVQRRDHGIRAKPTFSRRPAKEKSTSRYDALRAMREQQYARGRR